MTHAEMNLIAENPQSTVVAEYMPSPRKAEHYQTEADLEREFIAELQKQAYEYIDIRKSEDLVANLRRQLEKLNRYTFSDNEWRTFFETSLANATDGIEEKTYTLQEDYIKILRCDDGEIRNIYLLDKKDIHNNSLQVINQYATGG